MNKLHLLPEAEKFYCLYGIRAGDHIKLGYSSDPQERVKTVQTYTPFEVSLEWELRIGPDLEEVKWREDDLHASCEEYHVRGEWYSLGCRPMLFACMLMFAGISKAELSRRLGLSSRTVSAWKECPPKYAEAYLRMLIEFNRYAP